VQVLILVVGIILIIQVLNHIWLILNLDFKNL
jgi:hypothetical protein